MSEPSGLDSTSRHRAPPKREAGRRTRSAGSPEAAKQNSGACLAISSDMSAGVTPRFECGPKQAARVTPTTITPTAASVEPRGASRTPQQPTYTRRTEKTIVSPEVVEVEVVR